MVAMTRRAAFALLLVVTGDLRRNRVGAAAVGDCDCGRMIDDDIGDGTMSERNVLRNELCIAGQDLKKGDFVKFSDGGRWYRADKCAEADADGVCTAARKQYQMVEVDVFEPWSYSWFGGYFDGDVAVEITRHPDNTVVASYGFKTDDEATGRLIIDLLIEKWGAKWNE